VARSLILCDYHPVLLESLTNTFDHTVMSERIFLRKRHHAEWQNTLEKVITLPLPIFWEESRFSIWAIVSLTAYLIASTLVGIMIVVKRRLNIIIGIYAFPQGLATFLVGQLTHRRPVVLTDGGDIDILLRKPVVREVILWYLGKGIDVVALNRTKANLLKSLGISAAVCPTFGVDLSRFRYVPYDKKEKHLIIFVGRLSDEKCPQVLLTACNRVRRSGIDFRLLLIGDGPLKKSLKDEITRLQLKSYVVMEDYVPHSRIHRLFQRSGIFVLPSRREGVSVSLLEAMSSGCLCITSDIPDNKDIVQHMKTGLNFRLDDAKDLAWKIRWAIENAAQVALITQNARLVIERKYSSRAVGRTLSLILSRKAEQP
jgi:glycosyltransferase involved in cell wall biosynthesis